MIRNWAIQLIDVSKTYNTPAGAVHALSHINLDIPTGSFVGIIGKSGAGKSTMVNMITGVDNLTTGKVLVENVSVHDMKESQRNSWRGTHIGIVYQSFELLNQLTLLENVMLAEDFAGNFHPTNSKQRAMQLLNQMEIGLHANKLPTEISGGQQQRVAIARALANEPLVLVADEPTGNLDSKTSETILNIFEELCRQGVTIVMVTHNQHWTSRFSKVYTLVDGRISPRQLLKDRP